MRSLAPLAAPVVTCIALVISALVGAMTGCVPKEAPEKNDHRLRPAVGVVDVSGAAQPRPVAGPAILAGARNEWVSFAVSLTDLSTGGQYSLRIRSPRSAKSEGKQAAQIDSGVFDVYRIVSMPVDLNRAGYVRHTGHSSAVSRLPRALVPVAREKSGVIDVQKLRERAPKGEPPQLWVDVRIPADAPAGEFEGSIELLQAGRKQPVAALPLRLKVYDFTLPDQRHLQVVGRVSWDGLTRHYGAQFETATPRLLNRADDRYRDAVQKLDQLVRLAQHHRASVYVPRLQPTVKWTAKRAEPQVDWDEFDGLVSPWLSGAAFPDGVALGFWPIPAPDHLGQYDRGSQLGYWKEAARHFENKAWLERSPILLDKPTTGRVGATEAMELSQHAGQILRLHELVRVALPLEDDQVQLTERDGPEMIDPGNSERLWAAAPGLVFSPPTQFWPDTAGRPNYWLRTDTSGLVPYAGAGGDERDVRLWAWLAFLRQARMISWGEAFPTQAAADVPADPADTPWFYPGHWFGVDEPVPSLQLKWLRRAAQDYEYLRLARERGEVLHALVMARLITKPVRIQPGQSPDPAYALMCGTSDPAAWDEVHKLLARTIELRQPGRPADESQQQALHIETLRWAEPQERPVLMGRSVRWMWDNIAAGANGNEPRRVLAARVGVDVYNASDNATDNPSDRNVIQWTGVPQAWQVRPQPLEIPALETYHVRHETLDARLDLDRLGPGSRRPAELTFTDGFTNRASVLRMSLPAAASERIEGRALATDGRLDEWATEDLIHDGPLVQMLCRPALQRQELRPASQPSRVYTGWTGGHFHFAFDLKGITPENLLKGSQNFVDYQFRRAWGEDLCAVLIQPVYDDNRVGPVLHLVCKPGSGHWLERKLDRRRNANPWQPLEGFGIRYCAVIDGRDWRGEVAVPWGAITGRNEGLPTLLRFNFIHHRTATGESASWAGPIDDGRDENITGVLHLRESRTPGVAGGSVRAALVDWRPQARVENP